MLVKRNNNNFKKIVVVFVCVFALTSQDVMCSENRVLDDKTLEYISLIKKEISNKYTGMFREAGGNIAYKFLTPGSDSYSDVLWDWDSWLSNIAIRQALALTNNQKEVDNTFEYEKGCILNFLSQNTGDGWIPISIERKHTLISELFAKKENYSEENMHKPCLVQHAAFIIQQNEGDNSWLIEYYGRLKSFLNNYHDNSWNPETGLYFWQTDFAIGVDNDPSVFYRPHKSSGAIFLNTMMYKELLAMAFIAQTMGNNVDYNYYTNEAQKLKSSIQDHCWDPIDKNYYSVDLNLLPINPNSIIHKGAPRTWNSVIERIRGWSGFMALWANVATDEQARQIVENHIQNRESFNAAYGIRTLDKREKMYSLVKSGNPSCWLGPVWGISNYMTWKGLINYGFDQDAYELAIKTIHLFGHDLEENGELHEYYHPETGEGINNIGFQNWNYLVLNMIFWLERNSYVTEF